MSKPTGGRIFARPHSQCNNGNYGVDVFSAQPGMTLRQLYAGVAMHALLSSNPERRFSIEAISNEAHQIADAMIAAGDAKP